MGFRLVNDSAVQRKSDYKLDSLKLEEVKAAYDKCNFLTKDGLSVGEVMVIASKLKNHGCYPFSNERHYPFRSDFLTLSTKFVKKLFEFDTDSNKGELSLKEFCDAMNAAQNAKAKILFSSDYSDDDLLLNSFSVLRDVKLEIKSLKFLGLELAKYRDFDVK